MLDKIITDYTSLVVAFFGSERPERRREHEANLEELKRLAMVLHQTSEDLRKVKTNIQDWMELAQ